jgi:hypothetical protein
LWITTKTKSQQNHNKITTKSQQNHNKITTKCRKKISGRIWCFQK